MSLFKNRNYLILFSGQIVSTVGNNLFSIALPWYVLVITGSKSALALTGLVQSLPVFLGLFVGVLVDRWRKRQTMIYSDLIRAGLSFALFALSLTTHPSFAIILALVLLLQTVGTVFSPASTALLPKVLKMEDIPAASGVQQSASAAASLGGMLGGGALMSIIGAPILFLGNAISFVISVTSLFFIRVKEDAVPKSNQSLLREWREGLKVILQSKFVVRIVAAGILVNFAGAPVDIVLTAWIKYTLHGSAYMLGFFAAAQLVGVIVGGILLGPITKRVDIQRILMVCLILIGICLGVCGVFANFYWNIACVFVCGLCEGLLNGALGATIIQAIPQKVLGRVIGTLQSSMAIAQPLGMAVVGFLILHLSLPVVFECIGACSLIAGLSFVLPLNNDTSELSQSA